MQDGQVNGERNEAGTKEFHAGLRGVNDFCRCGQLFLPAKG
jgi:hypothetical protein